MKKHKALALVVLYSLILLLEFVLLWSTKSFRNVFNEMQFKILPLPTEVALFSTPFLPIIFAILIIWPVAYLIIIDIKSKKLSEFPLQLTTKLTTQMLLLSLFSIFLQIFFVVGVLLPVMEIQ